MKKAILVFIILISAVSSSYSIEGYWKKIQNIPQIVQYNHWLDIYFLPSNPSYGWACGMDGRVLLTTDGGVNWQLSNQQLATGHLERIMFVDQNIGFCSGTVDQASPPGVYRSTNGGKTWVDITPIQLVDLANRKYESAWSCFFIDKNNGVYCGGDCLTDSIYFWRTTNGGNDWSEDRIYCPDNRLCDAVLYSTTGEGYGLSGTVFWKTTDGGFKWDTLSVTGSYAHQEEISKYGQMVLIPYSGNSCDGGSNRVGGFKLSRDGGLTWKAFPTGNNMFGAFMTSNTEGWACGDNASVYYTDDGGVSWSIKNCGINGNDLDDIFFLDPTKGWTGGKDGIFVLSPIEQRLSKTNVDFPTTCLSEEAFDTIWVSNKSFDNVQVKKTLTSTDQPDIKIVAPAGASFNVPSCDSVAIIISYIPKVKALQIETWAIEFQSGPMSKFTVTLKGDPAYSTAKTTVKLITDTVYCNTKKTHSMDWTVETNIEYVWRQLKTTGSTWINFVTPLPYVLKKDQPNTTTFELNPQDTGWTNAKFRLTTNPCDNENDVEVKCYGVSSIITTPKLRSLRANCFEDKYDTILVKNTGNYDLIIDKVTVMQGQSYFSVVSWLGEGSTTTIIKPKKEKNLIIKYINGNDGIVTGVLRFKNNDSTKVNGNKNPYDITITAFRGRTNLFFLDDVVDFGTVCAKEKYTQEVVIRNIGKISANVHYPTVNSSVYELTSDLNRFPYEVKDDSTGRLMVSFTPTTQGLYLDTIDFVTDPCGEPLRLIIRANILKPELLFIPDKIEGITQAGFDFVTVLRVINIGEVNLNIRNMYIDPAISGVSLSISPPLPITLNTGSGNGTEADFTLTFNSKTFTEIKNCLKIEADGICPLDTCVPLDITVIDRLIRPLRDTIDYGFFKCDYGTFNEKLQIYNEAMQRDTIIRMDIIQSGNEFKINQAAPIYIDTHDTLDFDLEFTPQTEGVFTGVLQIETKQPNGQVINIPIKAEFRKTITTPLTKTFDEGISDTCIGIKKYTVLYENQGTLEDTLQVQIKDNMLPVWTDPADKVIVPALGSSEFNIYIDYGKFGFLGLKDVEVNLTSLVCGDNYNVHIKSDLRAPVIVPTPAALNFVAWVGYTDTKTIKLKNDYGKALTIKDIKIAPQNGTYTYNFTIPKTMAIDEEIQFDIIYTGVKEGSFVDTLFVTTEDNCIEQIPIELKALTPNELYNIALEMDSVQVKMGDTVDVYLRLKNPVDLLVTDNIEYSFRFNSALAYPNKVWVRNKSNVFEEASFSNKIGVISGQISGENATNLFTTAGKIMKINFRSLRYYPDTTSIYIDKFDPIPEKKVAWQKRDGFLRAVDYCVQEVSFGISITPQFEAKVNEIITQSMEVELNSDVADINVAISFVGLSGTEIYQTEAKAKAKGNKLSIDLSDVQTGTYFCIFRSEYGQIETRKVIVIK
ncbi:MAG: hypothetical protein WCR42_00495 [bacterium]